MDLTQNYYQLFGLEKTFLVDKAVLGEKYRKLQREFHPDKFASKSASEQRLSVQFTSLLNSAYQTLKSPLLSAEYLLSLSGHPVKSDSMTIEDNEFLFLQMEWRESLSDFSELFKSDGADKASVYDQLQLLREQVMLERQELIDSFEAQYGNGEFDSAIQIVAKFHFVEKMLSNIEHLEDQLIV